MKPTKENAKCLVKKGNDFYNKRPATLKQQWLFVLVKRN